MSGAVPSRLGKYEIRGTLGKGAMGTVYDGWDPVIDRRVAIKTVRLPNADEEEAVEALARFKREAQAAGRLTHPNIVGVFDYGETDELAYIVMEFVEGRSLKDVLGAHERMSVPTIVGLMEDVLAGLTYSHGRGVVHRDIKPANIMLTADGRAKIADFGIARIEASSMTQAGTVMGTPAYMSPEQFMGQVVDRRTDIYSCGVMLYQLLTGDRPFDGSMTAIMHKALTTTPPPPSALAVTAPQAFDPIVARAMARRPEDRFDNAAGFAQALRAAAAEPILARPVAEDPLASEETIVAPRSTSASRAPAAAPPPASAPAKSKLPMFVGAGVGLAVVAGSLVWLMLPKDAPSVEPTRQAVLTAPPPAIPAPAQPPPVQPAPAVPAPSPVVSPPPVPPPPIPTPAVVTPATPVIRTVPTPAPAPTPVPAPPIRQEAVVTPPPAPPVVTKPVAAPVAPPAPSPFVIPAAPVVVPPPPPPPPPVVTPPAPPPQVAPQPVVAPPSAPPPPPPQPVAPRPAPPPVVEALNVPPPPPRRASSVIEAALTSGLPTVRCSLLREATGGDGGVTVSGVVGAGQPEAAAGQVVATAGPASTAFRTQSFSGPFCPALDLLRPISDVSGTGRTAMEMSQVNGPAVLRDNDVIAIHVTMPGFAGYLHVAYLQNDATVSPLVPGDGYPAQTFPARAQIDLGNPRPGFAGWHVGPPPGTDMIVAVASTAPLFAKPLPDSQPIAAYLASLQAAMDDLRRHGGTLAGAAMVLDTRAGG